VRSEVKQLVLDNRTADRAAELVAVERIVCWRKEIAGVERTIAQELKKVTVDLVGARARHNVHYTARGVAELGGEVIRIKSEFLNSIRVGERQVHIEKRVVVPDAIELIVHLRGSSAIDGRLLLTGVNAAKTVEPAIPAGSIHGSGRKK